MSAASNYTETNILNAVLRGVAFPLPTHTYIALHTATPDEGTGSNEVTTGVWPSYVRKQCESGGAIGTGWTVPAANGTNMESKNVYALPFPAKDGATAVTVTSWSIWDAATGGNMLLAKDLVVPVIVDAGELIVFDINALTVTTA